MNLFCMLKPHIKQIAFSAILSLDTIQNTRATKLKPTFSHTDSTETFRLRLAEKYCGRLCVNPQIAQQWSKTGGLFEVCLRSVAILFICVFVVY